MKLCWMSCEKTLTRAGFGKELCPLSRKRYAYCSKKPVSSYSGRNLLMYLDVTRLLERVRAQSPTGIDRVEFEYAKYLHVNGANLVTQIGERLAIVPSDVSRELLDFAAKRWNGTNGAATMVPTRFAAWGRRLDAERCVSKFLEALRNGRIREAFLTAFLSTTASVGSAPQSANLKRTVLLLELLKRLFFPSSAVVWLGRAPMQGETWYINVGHSGLNKSHMLNHLRTVCGIKIAIYIHDLLPVSHPDLFREGELDKHLTRIANVERNANIVLTNSLFTAGELSKRTNIKGAAVLEIGTLAHGGDDVAADGRSGFVSIGTIEPRKNYLWLVRCWLEFCEAHPELVGNEKLTIFGRAGWLSGAEQSELHKMADETSRVQIISGANDREIGEKVASARAYVSAAHVEGWGMPLAESLSAGTPVIASDVPAHREVTQHQARFFRPGSADDLIQLLTKCFDQREYQQMLEATSRFQPWGWDEHFKKLEAILAQSDGQDLSNVRQKFFDVA